MMAHKDKSHKHESGDGVSEASTQVETTATSPAGVEFVLQRIYVRDLSFEAPNSPQVFLEAWQPAIELEVQNQANELGNGNYDVIMKLKVTAKLNDKVAYLVEVQQAGVFTIKNASDEQMKGIMGALCPTILFPYARESVSNIVTHGGFPQLLLAPINFDALFLEQLNRENESATSQGETIN